MNIVVCGGGTAGWLGAYIISRAQPGLHKITVVESSSIDIIGAGEGSTGILFDVVSGNVFGDPVSFDTINTFMEKTDATRKIGIRHINWNKEKGSYFAPIDGSAESAKYPDINLNHVLSTIGNDKAYLASHMGQCFENGYFPSGGHAFHFDGRKIGPYFRELLERNPNVSFIDANIEDVVVSSAGNIEKIVLDKGREVSGDFFIDCTGFAKVLSSKLGVGWKSYKENLPVDRAIPFILDYKFDGTEEIEPLTRAQALSSGWMWNIPLKTRMGCGYVYSSEFLSDEQAVEEVSRVVGKQVEPLKYIKFDSGRVEQTWKNNCLSLGLAAGFSEPLEATSIQLTIYQSLVFCYEVLEKTIEKTATDKNIEFYNKAINQVYDDYRDFISLHYQGGRDDSEFWRYIKTGKTKTSFVDDIIEHSKLRIPSRAQYGEKLGATPELYNWILSGLGKISPETAREELNKYGLTQRAAYVYEDFKNYYVVDPEVLPKLDKLNFYPTR
jgi:tryptophan halogenase